jgi:hypothetical protein
LLLYYQGQSGYVYYADREGLSEAVPPTSFGSNKYYTSRRLIAARQRRITNSASLLKELRMRLLQGRKKYDKISSLVY